MPLQDENLRKAGLKATLPRMKILQMMEEVTPHHLSAEDVFQRLKESSEEVGLATVYRVLTQFEEAGLVIRHNFEGGHSVFEINQGEHHDHLVCIKCNRVEEFVDDVIEQRQTDIASDANFQITDHSLTIYGVCADCQLANAT